MLSNFPAALCPASRQTEPLEEKRKRKKVPNIYRWPSKCKTGRGKEKLPASTKNSRLNKYRTIHVTRYITLYGNKKPGTHRQKEAYALVRQVTDTTGSTVKTVSQFYLPAQPPTSCVIIAHHRKAFDTDHNSLVHYSHHAIKKTHAEVYSLRGGDQYRILRKLQ